MKYFIINTLQIYFQISTIWNIIKYLYDQTIR